MTLRNVFVCSLGLLLSTLTFADDKVLRAVARPNPFSEVDTGKFDNSDTFQFTPGVRTSYVLTDKNPKPTSTNKTSKATKVMVDINCFKQMVDKFIVNQLFLLDGNAKDDTLEIYEKLGVVIIAASSDEELREAKARLTQYEKLCWLASDLIVDKRTKKKVVFEGKLREASFRATTLPHQTIARMNAFKTKFKLASNESINWDSKTGRISYRLRSQYVAALKTPLTVIRQSIKVNFRPEAVKAQLAQLQKSLYAFEKADFDEATDIIDYELTPLHEISLNGLLAQYDKKPREVVIQVKLLSVTSETQTKLGAAFNFQRNGSDFKNTTLTDLLSGAPNLHMIQFAKGKELVDATIDALVDTGKGVRHNLPDITTIEHYKRGMKPTEFKNVIKVPIQNITNDNVSVKEVEVGLTVKINNLRVVESPEYKAARERLEAEIVEWGEKNADDIAMTNKFLQARTISLQHHYNLATISSVLRKRKSFAKKRRKLNDYLQIITDFKLEDGGIRRTVETSQSINVEYDKLVVDSEMILDNSVPRFLAGNNTKSRSSNKKKVPLLASIPGLGLLFQNKSDSEKFDSIVVFLTITVRDDQTDAFTAAQYSRLGQRAVTPTSMGGYALDSIYSHPLRTGRRSKLAWIYDGKDGGAFGRAKSSLERSVRNYVADDAEGIDAEFLKARISSLFLSYVYGPIKNAGLRQDEDWLSFSRVKYELDHLAGYADAEGHPFVVVMKKIQEQVWNLTGEELSLTEILALVRDAGRMGRGFDSDRADERLTVYMTFLIAKYTDERSVFKSERDVRRFENKYLPRFHRKDGAKFCAKRFEKRDPSKRKKLLGVF